MPDIKAIHEKKPNAGLIRVLESLTARAETGELQGVIGVVIFNDGSTDDMYANPCEMNTVQIFSDRIIGALFRCMTKMANISNESRDADDG